MKLSGLVFHPKASSCPRNQWQPRNGLTFLSRSCLRQISQNDPCTFQNLANYLNCCFCIEQSLIIKDRYYYSVKKNSAVTEKYQIFTLFSWIIVIVMVIIVLLRLLYTAFKGLLYSWLYSMNGEYFQFIWTFINSSLSWNQKDIFSKSSRWRKIIGNFRIRKGISLWRVSIWVANFPWLKSSSVMQPGKHYTARPWPNFYHTCHNCFTNAWLWALCVYISAFYIADAWGALQIRWHCNNTLPRGGMYWKIRPPRIDLPKQGFCTPRPERSGSWVTLLLLHIIYSESESGQAKNCLVKGRGGHLPIVNQSLFQTPISKRCSIAMC